MPATVRGLYRPRRRRIKPRGTPRIIQSLAPRGLRICAPLVAGFPGLTGKGPFNGSVASPLLSGTPFGQGLLMNGGGTSVSYGPGLNPQVFSWEIIFCDLGNDQSGNMASISNGVSTTPIFQSNYPTSWQFDIYDAAISAHTLTGVCDFTVGKLQSAVLTSDGTTTTAYGNGEFGSSAALGALFNYSSANASIVLGGNWRTAVILLSNYADVCWTPTEVRARYRNPFGFLSWPEDRRHYLVGVTGAGTQNLSPPLFTNTNTFFSPTVGRGAVNLTPSLFTNTSTFFAPTVSGVYTLTPSLFTSPNTFYSPTVTSTYNLTPSLFTNNSTFFSATVTNAGNLAPSLFTNTNTFFSPTVGRGSVNLAPTLFANSNIFYSPTVAVAQPQALLPSLYTNPNTFFLPVVRSHIVLINVHVKLKAPHVFDNTEWPAETIFGPPDGFPVPSDFQYTPLMEGLGSDSIRAIAQVYIDIFGRYDAHGNLLDNPPIPRPIYDPQPTPAVGNKHFLPLGNGSWP